MADQRPQIAFADVILLNKTDLISAEELDQLEGRIRNMNRFCKIFRTRNTDVEIDRLLDIGAFDLNRALEVDPNFLVDSAHQHDETVTSVGIELPGDLDEKRFNQWIGELLREKGTDIFRMKGILSIAGSARQFVFQGVHMLFDASEGRAWGKTTRGNKLIFIGRNLDRAALNDSVRQCLA